MARKRSFLYNCMKNVRQIDKNFDARFSGVFADVEAPGDEIGKH